MEPRREVALCQRTRGAPGPGFSSEPCLRKERALEAVCSIRPDRSRRGPGSRDDPGRRGLCLHVRPYPFGPLCRGGTQVTARRMRAVILSALRREGSLRNEATKDFRFWILD